MTVAIVHLLSLLAMGLDTFVTGRWIADRNDRLWVGIDHVNGEQQEHLAAYIGNRREATL